MKHLNLLVCFLSFALCGCGSSGDIFSTSLNFAPVVSAGANQSVITGNLVSLSGRGFDANGDTLTYDWMFSATPSGSTAVLSDSSILNPSFTADLDGSYVLTLTINDAGGSSTVDSITITATTFNAIPIVNAGPDQNVLSGTQVFLSGTGSDDDGDLLTFNWVFTSMPSGSGATLSDPDIANPSFTVDLDGVYVLTLTGNDGTATSAADSISVTADSQNSVPTANAGPDQNIVLGSLVSMSGNGTDADGDLLTFTWSFSSKPAGSVATLTGATTATPNFTADLEGSYVLSLICNDGTVDSLADSITITAATLNSSPVAIAGPDQNIETGSLLLLSGNGTDADGDLLSFSWTFASKPFGSTAILSDSSIANPTFTADLSGTYVLNMTVDDGIVTSALDSITITASSINSVPTVNAGVDLNVKTGDLVTLNGSWFDADSDTLTFTWVFTSMPSGSTASLSDSSIATPTFTVDQEGIYILSFTGNDGTVSSSADLITISATSPAINSEPRVNAGPVQNVTKGDFVTLNGSGVDADGDSLTFVWSFISRPSGSTAVLSDPNVANSSFTADQSGSYVLSLIGNDGVVNSLPDTVTITVQEPSLLVGTSYLAGDGLTVTMDSISVVNLGGTYTYEINYTLLNASASSSITEGRFKLYFSDYSSISQSGTFSTLLPGDSKSVAFTFEAFVSKTPTVVSYLFDNFSSNVPPFGALSWDIILP